jgi:hypothetical protein
MLQAGDGLLQSMTATSRNIGLMHITHGKLGDDIRSKSAASAIDASVIRMRKQKANHRWCPQRPHAASTNETAFAHAHPSASAMQPRPCCDALWS